MKIAVSAMGDDLNSMLDVRFGRCNYFEISMKQDGLISQLKTAAGRGRCRVAAAHRYLMKM